MSNLLFFCIEDSSVRKFMFFDIGVNDKLFRPLDFMLTGGKYSTYESYLSVYLIPEVASISADGFSFNAGSFSLGKLSLARTYVSTFYDL